MAMTLTAPRDANNVNIGFGVWANGATPTEALVRILNASQVASEGEVSGALSVGGMIAHDSADVTALGPVKVGGKATATAPSDVTANDIVNAWHLLNGTQVVQMQHGGVLVGIADDAAFTPATSVVIPAGFEADESGTDSVDEGDAGAARMTLDRKLIINAQPHTAGGLSTFLASGADGAQTTALTSTAVEVKASAGQLYGYWFYNPNDEVTYLNFYNIAQGSVTVGTSTVKAQFALPAGAAANISFAQGIEFSTAITVSATETEGTNTAPDTAVFALVLFK